MKKLLVILLIALLVKWWYIPTSITPPGSDVKYNYQVEYSGGADKGAALPMLIALHGNGDTPSNFHQTALNELTVPARVILFEAPLPYGRGSAWPWSVEEFNQYGDPLAEAIKLLTNQYPTTAKPVLLGFSGGGAMAYYQSITHGYDYSFIFPISGQLSQLQLGNTTPDTGAKVFAYHGTNDSVVSIGGGKSAVNLLKANEIEVQLTEFSGGHHGIFREMKSDITQLIEEKIRSLR